MILGLLKPKEFCIKAALAVGIKDSAATKPILIITLCLCANK
jgi:hypothetical protein